MNAKLLAFVAAAVLLLGLAGGSGAAPASQRDSMIAALDGAYGELIHTTVGYDNTYWSVPPVGSRWAKGLAYLYTARGLGSSDAQGAYMDEMQAKLLLTTAGYSRSPGAVNWEAAMNGWQGARTAP